MEMIIMNEIVPKIKPTAPKSLKSDIINKIKKEKSKMKTIKKLSAVAALIVALLILPFLFSTDNQAKAAMSLLSESIDKSEDLKTMVIKFLMRTTPVENFEALHDGDFVEHIFTESFENPPKVRLEKSKRVAIFDGYKSYLLVNGGDALVSTDFARFFGVGKYFFEPKNILKDAQEKAKSAGAKIKMEETENQIILTIETKAQGDYTNDYMKNADIDESDNKHVYIFDKETKLLKNLEISVLYKGKYETVLKTTSIEYNVPVDMVALLSRPENIEYTDLSKKLRNPALANITAKEAATLIFTAMANKNIEPVKEAFIFHKEEKLKKYNFWGLEIIEIGKPFTSGDFPGEFVPYKVKLSNGKILKHNLALKYDSVNEIWYIDGGI
jgi:hypothetical protein